MIIVPSLAGYWPLEGSALDASGKGNNGTITGAVSVEGKFGQGLLFNGTSDSVNCGTGAGLNLVNAFTLCAWAKFNNTYRKLIICRSTGGPNAQYYLGTGSSNQFVFIFKNADTQNTAAGPVASTGIWYHVAGVYNGTNLLLYINGLLATSTAKTVNPPELSTSTYIGDGSIFWLPKPDGFFSGVIDEAMIFNKALPASDIQRVMLGMHPLSG